VVRAWAGWLDGYLDLEQDPRGIPHRVNFIVHTPNSSVCGHGAIFFPIPPQGKGGLCTRYNSKSRAAAAVALPLDATPGNELIRMLAGSKRWKQVFLHACQLSSKHHPHQQLAGGNAMLNAGRQHDHRFQILCQRLSLHLFSMNFKCYEAELPTRDVFVKCRDIWWNSLHEEHDRAVVLLASEQIYVGNHSAKAAPF
jgi:hypothetical protein